MSHQEIKHAVPGLKPVLIYQKKTEPCQNCAKEDHLKEIKDKIQTIANQNEVIMKTLADHKVLIKRILYQEASETNLASKFPIDSLNELDSLHKTITKYNRKDFMNVMKSLFKGRLPKTLTQVMSTNLCMDINLDGIHGKKRLKNFAAFYDTLTNACRSLGLQEVESDLRNALKIIKKRNIHAQCMKNRTL